MRRIQMTTNEKMTDKTINLEVRKKNLLFSIERSIRYNTKRQHFFECWERGTNFLSVLFGSGTLYAVLQSHQSVAIAVSIALTVCSSLSLVIGFSEKARDHRDFSQQFLRLKERLIIEPLTLTLCNEIKIGINRIDLQEPPVLMVLEQICYNEQLNAEGLPREKMTKIKWYQRLFAHYIDIFPHSLLKK